MNLKTRFIFAVLAALSLSATILAAEEAAEYTGTIVTKNGAAVTIRLDAPPGIAAGGPVAVYTFFTKDIFGMKTSGWLHAAEAKLVRVKGSVVTVAVTEEKSRMMVNGKKVEHLIAGARVKVVRK